MQINLFSLGARYIGVHEIAGEQDHPLIRWWHSLCGGEAPDEVPWCSSFVNGIAWELGVLRSSAKAARSWLAVGATIEPAHLAVGWDIVIVSRGAGPQPGPDVLDAPGHVGIFAGWEGEAVRLLAGNQGNQVSVAPYPVERVLGLRRLYIE